MKKYNMANLAAVFTVSFMAWCYCVATAVLGLVYQAYPGQDSKTVLIATLPTVVTIVAAFLATPIFRAVTRKWAAIISLIIAFICSMLILYANLSLIAVIACSALLGIPAGLIPAANASLITIVAPLSLRDKVIGWHNALMMLGMAAFTFLAGLFAKSGDFHLAYKAQFILIPAIIIAILFYPNVDRDQKRAGLDMADDAASGPASGKNAGDIQKFPWYAAVFVALYLIGCIFWNAWYMNYSDYVINVAKIGDASVAGLIGTFSSIGGTIAGFIVPWFIKGLKGWSMPVAFIVCGLTMLLPPITQSAVGCYIGGFVCQLFNLFIVSGLTTYAGLGTEGTKFSTLTLSLITVGEGAGVFLCGYILPVLGNFFGGGAGANLIVGSVAVMIIGVVSIFLMRPAHKIVYGDTEKATAR